MLWPIFLVLLAHAVAGVAPLLVLAVRDGTRFAWVGLAVLGTVSAAGIGLDVRARGRPGGVTALIVGTWLLSGAAAVAAHRVGLV